MNLWEGDLRKIPKKNKSKSIGPTFAVWAEKDPLSGGLYRIQMIKVWSEGGETKEQIFEIVNSGNRTVNPETGKIEPLDSTVDVATAQYDDTAGATQLKKVWRDPTFDPSIRAAYYIRVLEIETPRWSTYDAANSEMPIPDAVPETVQERAWSSPIWYTPEPTRSKNKKKTKRVKSRT